MLDADMRRMNSDLKKMLVEASLALARLDVDRLEELAQSCHALNRELPTMPRGQRVELARQAGAATDDMAVFGRVLEATRDNMEVMNRLRELQMGRLEYAPSSPRSLPIGSLHGDH
jgi:hypothetical protein